MYLVSSSKIEITFKMPYTAIDALISNPAASAQILHGVITRVSRCI